MPSSALKNKKARNPPFPRFIGVTPIQIPLLIRRSVIKIHEPLVIQIFLNSYYLFLMIRRPPRSPPFPYTTLFRSTIKTSPGTGLGLSICKELVRLHHGEIWRSEEHTSELQSQFHHLYRLLLEK